MHTSPSTDQNQAIQLIRDAIQQRQIRHGKHAATLLREHGHHDLADRIDHEVRAQMGHLSARQALTLLEAGDA
jgi:hypothetical protein